MHPLKKKRAYDTAAKKDGARMLVDRIWPRGVKKEELNHTHWLKEIAPSSELRKWFNHDPKKYESFKEKYKDELKNDEKRKEAIEIIQNERHERTVTLIYGSKEEKYNHATVLIDYIEETYGE